MRPKGPLFTRMRWRLPRWDPVLRSAAIAENQPYTWGWRVEKPVTFCFPLTITGDPKNSNRVNSILTRRCLTVRRSAWIHFPISEKHLPWPVWRIPWCRSSVVPNWPQNAGPPPWGSCLSMADIPLRLPEPITGAGIPISCPAVTCWFMIYLKILPGEARRLMKYIGLLWLQGASRNWSWLVRWGYCSGLMIPVARIPDHGI